MRFRSVLQKRAAQQISQPAWCMGSGKWATQQVHPHASITSFSGVFVPQQNTHPGFKKGTTVTKTSKSSHGRLKPPQRTAVVRTAQPAPLAQCGVIQRQKQCCLTCIPTHKYGHCCGLRSVSKVHGWARTSVAGIEHVPVHDSIVDALSALPTSKCADSGTT
jgi:hypothetical protein